MKKKVVVIGLDGATLTLLQPWMEQGKLPHLASMIREGSFGRLASTPEKLSPGAWTSFSTGVNPGKHGVYHFFVVDPTTLKTRIVNASCRKVEPFWVHAGKAGKRVCVINVPVTYPSDHVNGCMISGWDAPSIQSKGFSYPPELIDEIVRQFHDYPLVPSIKRFGSQPDALIADLHRMLDLRIALSKYLLKKEDWDLFVTVLTETDQVQHFFWHLTDRSHPLHNDKLYSKYGDVVLGIYEKCDHFIGEMMAELGEDVTIVIMSDHGAGMNSLGKHYLPALMEKTRFLQKKRNPSSFYNLLNALKNIIVYNLSPMLNYNVKQKLKKIIPINFVVGLDAILADYDWANTMVYPFDANLRINVKGRESLGVVSEGEEYEKVVTALVSMLKGCVDIETGRPVITDIIRKEDAYSGEFTDDAPDLILKWVDDFIIGGISCRAPDGAQVKIPPLAIGHHEENWTGEHADYGIFMAKGPDINNHHFTHPPQITDIAPTIMYLLGIPLPEGRDGKVLTDMFAEAFLKRNPSPMPHPVVGDHAMEMTYSTEEEDLLKQRFRDLGYMQ